MSKEIKAIPTRYKNILFRSRLEAQWAIFFDELEIKWQYEPEYNDVKCGAFRISYLPDFYLPDYNLWIEVKPNGPRHLSYAEIMKIVGLAEQEEILVLSGRPRILQEDSEAHYLYTYNPQNEKVNQVQYHIRWCECPKCKTISYERYGGIPNSCYATCYKEPLENLLDEYLPDPEGHKSERLKKACHKANNFKFDD